jgi:hypothetical protein
MTKPLHVQVAEALGEKPCQECLDDGYGEVWHHNHTTDWNATGPLIEKLHIELIYDVATDDWLAQPSMIHIENIPEAPTPLIAVCNLILKLKEAGKL